MTKFKVGDIVVKKDDTTQRVITRIVYIPDNKTNVAYQWIWTDKDKDTCGANANEFKLD